LIEASANQGFSLDNGLTRLIAAPIRQSPGQNDGKLIASRQAADVYSLEKICLPYLPCAYMPVSLWPIASYALPGYGEA